MFRAARLVLFACIALFLAGCRTSEIKNENDAGLAADVPAGSLASGYGDGKGDSIGGGGAAQPIETRAQGEGKK